MITTAEFLRVVAAIIILAAAYLFLRALAGTRRAQTAAYYSTRREAQRTANNRLSTAVTLVVISIGLAIVSLVLPSEPAETNSATLSPPRSETTIAQPTVYILPTSTSVGARATNAPLPTQTTQPTPAHAIIATRLPTAEPASHQLTLRAISGAIDIDGMPISATAEFSKGIATVYVFFDYRDIPQGTLMRQTWFRDGGSVYFDSSTWTRTGNGNAYVVWSPKNGFDPGLYEVRVMLGNIKQFSANFMVH